ncbi:MAG: type II secretion system GspH family protein [Oscillospiraceae bacterium]|nr:type II secretion system GspH family protein [Oscillospiraceae bacterium]
MKKLTDKKGMTLIEFIVGMALFAIITTAISAVFTPVLRVQLRAREMAECNALLDNIANQMINDLSGAYVCVGTDNGGFPIENNMYISVNGPRDVLYYSETVPGADDFGILYRIVSDGHNRFKMPALPDGAMRKRQVWFSCELAGEPDAPQTAYILRVTVSSARFVEPISRDYAVAPLVLNQINAS